MKKFALVIASLITTSSLFSNFYLGGEVGLSMLKSRERTTIPPEQHELGGFGCVGGGFLGYHLGDKFDFGIEAFIVGGSVRNTVLHHQNNSKLSVKTRYVWGARVLPGYQFFEKVEAHLVLGYARGYFRLHDSGAYGVVSKNMCTNGYQVGAGLTITASKLIDVRVDEVDTGYASRSATGVGSSGTTVYSIKPYTFDSTVAFDFQILKDASEFLAVRFRKAT